MAAGDGIDGSGLFGFKKQQHRMTDDPIKRTRTPATAPTMSTIFELALLLGEGVFVGGEGGEGGDGVVDGEGGCTDWTWVAAALVITQVGSEFMLSCVLILLRMERTPLVDSAWVTPASCSIEKVTVETGAKSLRADVWRTEIVMRHLWHETAVPGTLELPQSPQSESDAIADTILSFLVLMSDADNGSDIESDTV